MAAFETIPADKKIRVVQVGCGGMAQGWVERTIKRPELEVVGLVDIRREAAEATANKHKLPSSVVYNTLGEALEKARPDAVFDITVPSAHFSVTIEALKAGCHVLGEKPLSDSIANARLMCQAADAARRLYMVTQNRRYIPQQATFTRAIRDGVIGDLSSLDAGFFIGAHFGGFRDVMEHVLIVDMAIHTFDQARMACGGDPVSAYCHEYNPKGSWYKGAAASICIFEMSNGVVFTYRGSWASEGFNTSWEAEWRAVGSKGTILWENPGEPRIQVVTGTEGFIRKCEERTVPPATLSHTGHEGVLNEFIESLRTGRTPQTDCRDNIKSLAMCFAALESAQTGKRVKVEY